MFADVKIAPRPPSTVVKEPRRKPGKSFDSCGSNVLTSDRAFTDTLRDFGEGEELLELSVMFQILYYFTPRLLCVPFPTGVPVG